MAKRAGSSCRDYIVSGVLVSVLAILLIIVRLERDASRFLRSGDDAYREGRAADALFHWKMSLEMYVPFSPTPGVAAGRLLSAAERFRKEGDGDMAARAFGYLRSGLLATRHLRQPMPELLAKAEEGLVRVLPAGPASNAGDRAPPGGTNIPGTALLGLGFLAWPVSVFRMIRGWRDSGKAFTPRLVIPAAGSLLLLAAGAILA